MFFSQPHRQMVCKENSCASCGVCFTCLIIYCWKLLWLWGLPC